MSPELSQATLVVCDRTAHLPLQKFLYFNALYAPVFGVANVALVVLKLGFLEVGRSTRIVLPILVIAWCGLEAARLYMGYSANLGAKVMRLGQFLVVTALLCLPIAAYLSFGQGGDALPLDLAVGLPLVALYAAQMRAGLLALDLLRRPQPTPFVRAAVRGSAAPSEPTFTRRGVGVGRTDDAATAVGAAITLEGDGARRNTSSGVSSAVMGDRPLGRQSTANKRATRTSVGRDMWKAAEASVRHVMHDSGGIFGSPDKQRDAAAPAPAAPISIPAALPPNVTAAPSTTATGSTPVARTMIARASAYTPATVDPQLAALPEKEPVTGNAAPIVHRASMSIAATLSSVRGAIAESWRHTLRDKGGMFGEVDGVGGAMIAPSARRDTAGGTRAGSSIVTSASTEEQAHGQISTGDGTREQVDAEQLRVQRASSISRSASPQAVTSDANGGAPTTTVPHPTNAQLQEEASSRSVAQLPVTPVDSSGSGARRRRGAYSPTGLGATVAAARSGTLPRLDVEN